MHAPPDSLQPLRILIIGASGSGTSTLGRALATELTAVFHDLDDFFWLCTTPAFTSRRPRIERLCMALAAQQAGPRTVMAGAPDTWGDALEDGFSHIVFLRLAAEIRVARLRERETRLLGHADPEFLAWAAQYDEGRLPGRSLAGQLAWLAERRCPVLRLEGDLSVAQRLEAVLAFLGTCSEHLR